MAAIAHGGTLDPPDEVPGPWLRERWAALGALKQGHLLPAASDPVPSVLNGRYFLEQLTKALDKVASEGSGSASDPVSLFITASGLGRQQFTAGDAAQQQFTVEDHRFLYHFSKYRRLRYRDGGYEPEETNSFTDIKELARAARASASFPVAFAPTLESEALASRPPRARPKTGTAASWLVDGAVLDNAPFGPCWTRSPDGRRPRASPVMCFTSCRPRARAPRTPRRPSRPRRRPRESMRHPRNGRRPHSRPFSTRARSTSDPAQ